MDLIKLTKDQLLFLEKFFYEQVIQVRNDIFNHLPKWYKHDDYPNSKFLLLIKHICEGTFYYTDPFIQRHLDIDKAINLYNDLYDYNENLKDYEREPLFGNDIYFDLLTLKSLIVLQDQIYYELDRRQIPIPQHGSLVENTFSKLIQYSKKKMLYDFIICVFVDRAIIWKIKGIEEIIQKYGHYYEFPLDELEFIKESLAQNMHTDYIYELN